MQKTNMRNTDDNVKNGFLIGKGLFLVSIILLSVILVLSGCSGQMTGGHVSEEGSAGSGEEGQVPVVEGPVVEEQDFQDIVITGQGEIPPDECSRRDLEAKYIMFESKYCGHCAAALPKFKEACSELGIQPEILDISSGPQREKMLSYGLVAQYTPTFVFDCKYYIGAKSKEEFLGLLKEGIE